jgi:hypothetical protein
LLNDACSDFDDTNGKSNHHSKHIQTKVKQNERIHLQTKKKNNKKSKEKEKSRQLADVYRLRTISNRNRMHVYSI